MSQELKLISAGLWTSPNPLSSVPVGSFALGDNVAGYFPGILESRRGFAQHSVLANGSRLASFQSKLIALAGTTLKYYSSGWSSLTGSYTAPSGVRMKFLEAAKSLYFTTNVGVYGIDAYNATPILAGVPRAPGFGLDDYTVSSGNDWWLDDTQVAYRVVRGRLDVNSKLLLGPPSLRCVLYQSSGGDITPRITYLLPTGGDFAAGDILRFYRSPVSAGLAFPPSDEMGLVYEVTLLASHISAGLVQFLDDTTDDQRGVALYTNATQEGIAEANEQPPLSRDMCLFRNTTIFANTTQKYRLDVAINGVASHNNNSDIRVGDTFVVTDGTHTDTYTAGATENVAGKQFRLQTGLASGFNRVYAMQSLARVVNRTTRTVNIRAFAGDGGEILFETPDVGGLTITGSIGATTYGLNIGALVRGGGSTVTVTQATHPYNVGDLVLVAPQVTLDANFPAGIKTVVSRPDANHWTYTESGSNVASTTLYNATHSSPQAAWTPNYSFAFDNSRDPAGLAYSKPNQPGAAPIENEDTVGDPTKSVLRVVALRESVLIFKEDGLYRLTGFTPADFTIQPYDLTTFIAVPESAVALKDNVPYLGTRGAEYAGESAGVNSLGDGALDNTFLALIAQNASTDDLGFGVAYESEEQYLLWLPSSASQTTAPIGHCWTYFSDTNSWYRWPVPATHAIIDPTTNRLVLVNGTDVWIERKDYAATDYQDIGGTASITVVTDSTHITMSGPGVGDLITQGMYTARVLSAVGSALTLDTAGVWTVASATYAKAIDCQVQWLPATGENPGAMKNFQEIALNFRTAAFNWIDLTFTTDVSQTQETARRYGTPATPNNVNIRKLMPVNMARGVFLNVGFRHRQALANFELQSAAAKYRVYSTRTPSRGP